MKDVAQQVGLFDNLKAVVKTVREKGMQVFIVPYHRLEPGDENLFGWRPGRATSTT